MARCTGSKEKTRPKQIFEESSRFGEILVTTTLCRTPKCHRTRRKDITFSGGGDPAVGLSLCFQRNRPTRSVTKIERRNGEEERESIGVGLA